MICRRVIYRDFRNIESAVIDPDPVVSILHGRNAQGKTNLLEGMYFASQGRSFRCRRDGEMVRVGAEVAGITVFFAGDGREQQMSVRFRGGSKPGRVCELNGVRVTRHSETVGRFRTVLFTPAHLDLVGGSPEVRRHFLDMALCQLSPEYLQTLQRFCRLLDQRNAHLRVLREKNASGYDDTCDILSRLLATEGAAMARMREQYVTHLEAHVKTVFSDMVGDGEKPSIVYRDEGDEEALYTLLSTRFREEMNRGTTAYGPHRAELLLSLNGRGMKGIASQGQTRSMAIALKLAEGEVSKERSGEYPVYLLDDVFSELDAVRRSYLLSGVIPGQVIITSCDEIGDGYRVFEVEGGRVREC